LLEITAGGGVSGVSGVTILVELFGGGCGCGGGVSGIAILRELAF